MKTVIEIPSTEALPEACRRFLGAMGTHSIFAFFGEMGAGKTTFISALSRMLGVSSDLAGSPSFSIVNEYRSDTTGRTIYHFDLYRLDEPEEALDLGIDDYFDSGNLGLIEWPERIEGLLPDDTVRVDLAVNPDLTRTLTLTFPE